jgi:hypothetical protein
MKEIQTMGSCKMLNPGTAGSICWPAHRSLPASCCAATGVLKTVLHSSATASAWYTVRIMVAPFMSGKNIRV